ncbi:MAG: MFS transporter [Promethearchaeota archaeon]
MESKREITTHSTLIIVSFAFGAFLVEFFQGVFTGYGYFFFETEVGLGTLLVSLGFSIFSLWKAFSDPILGYLFDKPKKFWLKWGQKYPWIIASIIPWGLSIVFFYNVPELDEKFSKTLVFAWLLISTITYGLFFSIFSINYFGQIPIKFKLDSERRNLQGFMGFLSFLGMLLGALIPTFIISYGDKKSYGKMSLVVFSLSFFFLLLINPGVQEKKILENSKLYTNSENESFYSVFKTALKQKNFRILLLISFINQVIMSCVGGSLHYIIKYIFLEEIHVAVYLYVGYFGGALLGTPFWVKIANRMKNTKKIFIINALIMLLTMIPMFFVKKLGLIGSSIFLFPFAFSFTGFWSTIRVSISSDVLDELSLIYGKRKESSIIGIRSIFFQLGVVFQSLMFGLIHQLTDFDKNTIYQSHSAQKGIIFGFIGIPSILLIILIIFFWKNYSLTVSSVKNIKNKMMKENL